jgi:hypothetical protein
MEESIRHIELMRRPFVGCSNGEDSADSCRLDHRRKGFTKINTSTLCEPPDDLARFVSIKRTIRFEFVGEHPLARDDMSTSGAINQLLGVVGLKGAEFPFHGCMPVGIAESGTNRGWQWRDHTSSNGRGSQSIARIGFKDTSL